MNQKDSIHIFVVEDNSVFRLALKADIETTFPTHPITIHSFETGESCMDEFREIKPKVVILDYHLNSKSANAVDGIKVLDWIKKEEPNTHVIILTSDDHVDVAVKSFKHGASDYVVKSETKFRKINYSLMNVFKLLDAKKEAKKYKHVVVGLTMCILIMIGGIITVQIFNPSFFK